MKIEYIQEQADPEQGIIFQLGAKYNGQLIGKLAGRQRLNDKLELQLEFYAYDRTNPLSDYAVNSIPGSPFASVNQAKAALEYYFRDLTEV